MCTLHIRHTIHTIMSLIIRTKLNFWRSNSIEYINDFGGLQINKLFENLDL